jgi:hypothetical protein
VNPRTQKCAMSQRGRRASAFVQVSPAKASKRSNTASTKVLRHSFQKIAIVQSWGGGVCMHE